jgi:hypothetical protein
MCGLGPGADPYPPFVPGRAARTEEVEKVSAQIPSELIDDLMQTYVDWREECIAVQDAYERWSNGPDEEQDPAFAAYRAALDREEQASFVYAERIEQVAREHRETTTAPEPVAGGVGGRVIAAAGSLLRPPARPKPDTR